MLQALLDRTFQTRSIRVRLPDGRELTAGPGEPELTAVIADMKTALAIAANPDLADEIAELLRAHDIGHADAGRVFVARGLGLTADTVQRHRAGDCTTCRDYGVTW